MNRIRAIEILKIMRDCSYINPNNSKINFLISAKGKREFYALDYAIKGLEGLKNDEKKE